MRMTSFASYSVGKKYYEDRYIQLAVARGSIALHVWMFVAHLLYEVADSCGSNLVARDVDQSGDGGLHAVDEVAAFYIGDNQKIGDHESGESLYNLAEKGRQYFGTTKEGQAKVNYQVITLLRQMKDIIKYSDGCKSSNNISTKNDIMTNADQILKLMTIPLVQMLIHNMYEYVAFESKAKKSELLIETFAKALLPQISTCSPSTYEFLVSNLYDAEDEQNFMSSNFNDIVAALQKMYKCLGFTCAEVGSYILHGTAEAETECNDMQPGKHIVTYAPKSDIRDHSLIDLDILQMKMLMEVDAFDAAKHIFIYGRNSFSKYSSFFYRSIFNIGSSSVSSNSPFGPIFEDYYEGPDYGNQIAMRALNKKIGGVMDNQMRAIVIESSNFIIFFGYILGLIWDVVRDCQSHKTSVSSMEHTWDRAVAFYAGSLENKGSENNQDGQLLYHAANRLCPNFGTCNSEEGRKGNSLLNDKIMAGFLEGRDLIGTEDCVGLDRIARKTILPAMLAVLIQATLAAAFYATNAPSNSSSGLYTENVVAEAYVYASALVPLVHQVDRNSADLLVRNMIEPLGITEEEGEPMPDGYVAIFSAFEKVILSEFETLWGMDCNLIGTFVDVYRDDSPESSMCSLSSSVVEGNKAMATSNAKNDASINKGCYAIVIVSAVGFALSFSVVW
mmetsp:Transcript_33005/g.76042  ORF Transcript_33005/g.76042 Transcript_33005/m.76042 type:complete len:673 (-) Transcript_33005:78-2096(-)